jgi:hypothetical protein
MAGEALERVHISPVSAVEAKAEHIGQSGNDDHRKDEKAIRDPRLVSLHLRFRPI